MTSSTGSAAAIFFTRKLGHRGMNASHILDVTAVLEFAPSPIGQEIVLPEKQAAAA